MTIKSFPKTLAVLLLASVACPSFGVGWMTCDDCGSMPWNDTCYYANMSGDRQTGYWYDLEAECEEACNGPKECNTKKCLAKIESGDKQKYHLSGSIGYAGFGLSAGYENETSYTAGCEYSDTCSTPNCCVGPGYAYLKYSYKQKYRGYWNSSQGKWCKTCSGYGTIGTLRTFSNVLCGETEHTGYEPALLTLSSYCSSIGQT